MDDRYNYIQGYINLRRLPKVILEILRHTIVPTIGWDDSAVKWPSMDIVNVVLSRKPINLLDWMVRQMMECKKNVDAPLVFQPYIMALVLRTVREFLGVCETSHEVFIPFSGQERYLARDSSPTSRGILRLDS